LFLILRADFLEEVPQVRIHVDFVQDARDLLLPVVLIRRRSGAIRRDLGRVGGKRHFAGSTVIFSSSGVGYVHFSPAKAGLDPSRKQSRKEERQS
jgi:hypothetical protein